MTLAAFARSVMHQLALCRTWGQVMRAGDRLGLSRDLPFTVYRRALEERSAQMMAMANTRPTRAVDRRVFNAN